MDANNQFYQEFNTLSNYLRGFAMKLTRDQNIASDLYQETALSAFRNQAKFRQGTNMKAWLSTIMKNSFINQYRKNKRRSIVQDSSPEGFLLNANTDSATNEGEMKLSLDELTSVVDTLDEVFKKPFLMAYQGYKYEEIQQALGGVPMGTIKSRIHHARKILKRKINDLYCEVAA